MNFLASPPLVVAYALAGTLDVDLTNEPLGTSSDGKPVYLKDLWPSPQEIQETVLRSIDSQMFRQSYASVYTGDKNWSGIKGARRASLYSWDGKSTYVKNPPYFDGMTHDAGARCGTFTAHAYSRCWETRSPRITSHPRATSQSRARPRSTSIAQGVQPADFNSYGARRGNHEVMMRGTFANIRLRNLLAPGTEGGVTIHVPSGEQMSIYDAAMRYKSESTPLIMLAGREYGTGSSRDWAAKGTMLLGVRAVIAESFERIHRSNLIGMGVLPLQFTQGQNAQSLGLTGKEVFDISGLKSGNAKTVKVMAKAPRRQRGAVRGARAHRHTEGAGVLPSRRHSAVRAATACDRQAGRLIARACGSSFSISTVPSPSATRCALRVRLPEATALAAPKLLRVVPAFAGFLLGVTDRGALKAALIKATLRRAHPGRARRLDLGVRGQASPARASAAGARGHPEARARRRLPGTADGRARSLRSRNRAGARLSGVHLTGVRWRSERLDGTLSTPNRRGAEKARCLEALLSRFPGAPTTAYGNSAADIAASEDGGGAATGQCGRRVRRWKASRAGIVPYARWR